MGDDEAYVIEQLTLLAQKLPHDKKRQLQELIASWREDVRRTRRETYTEPVSFSSADGIHQGYARDISATGVFIQTPEHFEIGARISLVFTFISAPNPVRLQGAVVRVTDEGIGVCFDIQGPEQLARLDDIISQHVLIMRPYS
ncbi:PilZ domain-containing protein [Mariprofundus erugo]|uniref:PilZ domain-containing protein n=1 Tax=Mariprofundus erugo TaxID=2528639 RepID=A0A5R9GRC2_9PROT|nr:PilZ domain-containing protein [Mariprofundus erugo]TLS65734.1 PilZ domain-containing protein [Mariprofundus erugo]TLS77948.1 PilZ domain-containing protein [Mariprofundus erugo]